MPPSRNCLKIYASFSSVVLDELIGAVILGMVFPFSLIPIIDFKVPEKRYTNVSTPVLSSVYLRCALVEFETPNPLVDGLFLRNTHEQTTILEIGSEFRDDTWINCI